MREYCDMDKMLIQAFNRRAKPLKQPVEFRNISSGSLADERICLSMLNDALEFVELTEAEKRSLVWLAGWEKSTVRNIVNAFQKKMHMLST